MKIILRKNYETLGNVGEVVEVKEGYARNFLIPRGIAYVALKGNLKAIEVEKKNYQVKLDQEISKAEAFAAQLEKVKLNIPVQVGEEDRLFGSVTTQMISDSLNEKGLEVDKRKIELSEPIKSLGIYNVDVKIHPQVTGKVEVWVVRQD